MASLSHLRNCVVCLYFLFYFGFSSISSLNRRIAVVRVQQVNLLDVMAFSIELRLNIEVQRTLAICNIQATTCRFLRVINRLLACSRSFARFEIIFASFITILSCCCCCFFALTLFLSSVSPLFAKQLTFIDINWSARIYYSLYLYLKSIVRRRQ